MKGISQRIDNVYRLHFGINRPHVALVRNKACFKPKHCQQDLENSAKVPIDSSYNSQLNNQSDRKQTRFVVGS